jgi:hypothetical protein
MDVGSQTAMTPNTAALCLVRSRMTQAEQRLEVVELLLA